MPKSRRRRRQSPKSQAPPAQPAAGELSRPKASKKRSSPLRLVAALALFILIGSSIGLLWSAGRPADPATALPDNTLVEFADFQCPYCAAFAATTLPRLYDDYIASGVMRYQFRHYPFLGEQSRAAAQAAECAREQEAFGPYHDQLFEQLLENRERRGRTTPDLNGVAADIGLNLAQWEECVADSRYAERVELDQTLGRQLRIPGTPTLFLNGEMIDHNLLANYPALKAEIDRLLAENTSQ